MSKDETDKTKSLFLSREPANVQSRPVLMKLISEEYGESIYYQLAICLCWSAFLVFDVQSFDHPSIHPFQLVIFYDDTLNYPGGMKWGSVGQSRSKSTLLQIFPDSFAVMSIIIGLNTSLLRLQHPARQAVDSRTATTALKNRGHANWPCHY